MSVSYRWRRSGPNFTTVGWQDLGNCPRESPQSHERNGALTVLLAWFLQVLRTNNFTPYLHLLFPNCNLFNAGDPPDFRAHFGGLPWGFTPPKQTQSIGGMPRLSQKWFWVSISLYGRIGPQNTGCCVRGDLLTSTFWKAVARKWKMLEIRPDVFSNALRDLSA